MDSRQYAFEGEEPAIDGTARVSREATVVGDVTVAADASVWPGVVLRGDVGPVRVGAQSHVGDNAVLHASTVGEQVMVGHGAVLNDTAVEDGALVGFNSTVTESVIGEGSIVASGTVVPEGYEVPARSFVRGMPATVTPLSETTIDPDAVFEAYSSGDYTNLAQRHEDLFG
ncbi:gamma carbonic anhydrase family protein [Halorientalis sp. IM1011]|uniref:gamma carbonic anhydrase family protein n=1 Tax=Halorientalis sp. IM1011 TaxID=1932360 RepID=UPI00097CCE1F|nr:gamma carbonic anhydrase family protein [Halorientalis sp. IM1011]AQL43611.1 gamma carbonic anhydrase family protein [Halorientalis sp. IM1011]